LRVLVALVLTALLSVSAAATAPAAGFKLGEAGVTPRKAFFGAAPVRVEFRFDAAGPTDVDVSIVGAENEVRAFHLKALQPGDHAVEWNGVTSARRAAADGKYRVLIGEAGTPLRDAGAFTLRGHRYPVKGPHGFRGAVGEFGAGRNGGRTHEGFDIVARCGTPLVAARGGVVIKRAFDGALDGHYLIIRGARERRTTYRYSHLPSASPLAVGDRVATGQKVGVVGRSGNAMSVGCHLHFELKVNGRFVDPLPSLRRWDRHS
jgi:murein DD-endopeptidase MepM/ murein hydrolase activator NlpD